MFTLKSVTLRNFRLVNDATFTPLTEGITGIAGENGVGKSSFLAGVLWALFDVRPPDVPVAGLRRQGVPLSEECFVAVVFQHDGQEIEVIRELRGKSNRAVVNIYVDGVEQTHTSVKVANAWIKTRLKIDANTFTTAFVVRQKELDALVRARPAERRAIIEKLSGIEKMSAALKLAREEENDKRREVNSMPGGEDEVAAAKAKVQEQQVVVDEARDTLEEAQHNLAGAANSLEEKKATLIEVETYLNETVDLRQAVDAANQNIVSLDARIADQKAHAEPATREDVEKAHVEWTRLKDATDAARARYSELAATRRLLDHELATSTQAIEEAKHQIDVLTRKMAALSASTDVDADKELLNAKTAELANLTESKETVVSRGSALRSQLEAAELALKSLQASSEVHDAECPTCHTALANPQALIAAFEAQKTTLTADIENASKDHARITQDIQDAQQAITQCQRRIEDGNAAATEHARLAEELAAKQASVPTLEAKVEETKASIVALMTDLDSTANEGKSLAEKAEDARRAFTLAENGLKSNEAISALESEREVARHTLNEANTALAERAGAEADKGYSDATLRQMRDEVERESYTVQQYQSHVNSLETNLRVHEERLTSLTRDLDREKTLLERKSAGLALLASRSAVSDVLDEFRKDRIARVAPELSETATSLISAMTSGRYTEVLLDENFTPSLVDDAGNVRAAAWLSGGEESALALSLLIAIGDMITGGSGGLLWLDEVLTAQDANRRASLIDTLRNIPGRQIIMINHTPDATDMVDKIVHIVPTSDGSFMEAED